MSPANVTMMVQITQFARGPIDAGGKAALANPRKRGVGTGRKHDLHPHQCRRLGRGWTVTQPILRGDGA